MKSKGTSVTLPFRGIKMFKYLITDMDHTLLQENGDLDEESIAVIRRSPLQVSLASARNPYSMIKFIQQLRLSGPQLSMNGAIIFKVVNDHVKILQEETITRRLSYQLQQYLHQNYPQIDFTWITTSHWYIPRMTPQMQEEMQYSGVQPVVGKSLAATAEPCQIVLIIKDQQLFKRVQGDLQREFAVEHLAIRSSGDGYLTINAHGVSKGTLVNYLIKHGAKRSEIIGVGDDQNDLPMLEIVGHSLAVANAAPNVKAVADQVILSNHHDGIAHYLQQFGN